MEAQTAWGGLVPLYLFLGGLGGGALLLSAVLDAVAPKRYRRTVRPGAWVALVSLVAGVLFLLWDVGVPLRSLLLWQSFGNPSSWMAIGAWTLFAAIGLSALLCLTAHLKRGRAWWRTVLDVLCGLAGAASFTYTGILLVSASAIVTWGTWWIPALFVLSSLSSATAALELIYRFREKKKRAQAMGRWHILTVALSTLEAAALAGYCLWLASSPTTMPALQLLLEGALAPVFWALVAGAGIVAPWFCSLVALAVKREPAGLVVTSSLCALAGACALRFAVLGVGMRIVVALI